MTEAPVVANTEDDLDTHEITRGSPGEELIVRLCSNYIASIKASDPKHREAEVVDEELMTSIEKKIGIPDSRRAAFRREILTFVDALKVEGKAFEYFTNDRVRNALQRHVFEDRTAVDSAEARRRLVRSYRRGDESDDVVLALVKKIFLSYDRSSL